MVRPAARVVILDNDGWVLLQRMRTPDGWDGWITPGGGLEAGESVVEAASRELIEEVGIRDVDLEGPIWLRRHEFPWDGRLIAQEETFFLARLEERIEPAGEADAATLAAEFVVDHRWWKIDELESSGVVTAPTALVGLLRSLLSDGPPPEPIDAGV